MDETTTNTGSIDKGAAQSPQFKAGDKVMMRQGYGGQLMPAVIFDLVKSGQDRISINGAYLSGNEVMPFSVFDGDESVTLFPQSPMFDMLLESAKTRIDRDIANYRGLLNQSEWNRNTINKAFDIPA